MPRGRDQDVTTEDVIRCAKQIEEPCFVVSELADRLDVSGQTVRSRLETLVKRGIVGTKQAGRGGVYWIRCEGRE